MHYVWGCIAYVLFWKLVHICTFVWISSWSVRIHIYINIYICMYIYKRERFLLPKMEYILNILQLQNGHCGPVFFCDAYKCIWLSYKCIYNKVHLMLLMYLCRHSQAPCSSAASSSPPPSSSSYHPCLLPSHPYTLSSISSPWSEFRSATALTHTHDETEWDTIWLRLTHILGIQLFFSLFSPACEHMQARTHLPLTVMCIQ